MSNRRSTSSWIASLLIVAGSALAVPVQAKSGETVNAYQYAIDHPVEDSHLNYPPALGESVPKTISLNSVTEDGSFAYFYYAGRPVIVDRTTRSVVKIGK
ncbi:DUF1236 domain-containing protein [Mangrovicella endophytica]|uniref:DUF1236 domain-containing protein n=1 Tax=Mangrovicella endophytica TaxID=2066697 RepID=UPI000C9E3258|nr:DUF1236 domain-containing protein [Mangrovicella endophytica]